MAIKTQGLKRLELEERLIRISAVIKHLSKEIKDKGLLQWQYMDAVRIVGSNKMAIIIEDKEYDLDINYLDNIQKPTQAVQHKMLMKLMSSPGKHMTPKEKQKWKHYGEILHEANRLNKISQLEVRKQELEFERDDIDEKLNNIDSLSRNNTKMVYEHKRIKELVNIYMKKYKNSSIDEACYEISIKEQKSYEAVRGNYFYKGKK